MCDKNLQRGALRGSRTELGGRGVPGGSGGAVITRCGIDRRICHPTPQQNQPLTAPPHRVVHRPSFTGMLSLWANSYSYVPARPALAKGRNRPSSPWEPSWTHVVHRAVNDARHGATFRRQVYPGGIDRAHRFPQVPRGPTPAAMQHGVSESRKGITPRQSWMKLAMCLSKDNIR